MEFSLWAIRGLTPHAAPFHGCRNRTPSRGGLLKSRSPLRGQGKVVAATGRLAGANCMVKLNALFNQQVVQSGEPSAKGREWLKRFVNQSVRKSGEMKRPPRREVLSLANGRNLRLQFPRESRWLLALLEQAGYQRLQPAWG